MAADEVKSAREEQQKGVQAIQEELRRKGGEPWDLIAELISFDPSKRPSSEIAEQRLGAIVDNPASPYWRAIAA